MRKKSETPLYRESRVEDGTNICENPENTSDGSEKDPLAEEEVQNG